jgi:hypothetical protein
MLEWPRFPATFEAFGRRRPAHVNVPRMALPSGGRFVLYKGTTFNCPLSGTPIGRGLLRTLTTRPQRELLHMRNILVRVCDNSATLLMNFRKALTIR